MKRKKIFCYLVLGFVLLFMVPDVSAGWEEMQVLKHRFAIDDGPRHQKYVRVVYNPIDNEFMSVWLRAGH